MCTEAKKTSVWCYFYIKQLLRSSFLKKKDFFFTTSHQLSVTHQPNSTTKSCYCYTVHFPMCFKETLLDRLHGQTCSVTHTTHERHHELASQGLAQTERCSKGCFMPSQAATTYGIHILSVRRNLFTQLTLLWLGLAYEVYANAQLT